VQTVIPLPGHGAIKLTTARYYTPSGRSIQQVGIEPDITVPLARIEPLGVEHERRSEASLPHSLKNPDAKGPDGKAPDAKAPDGKAPDAKAPDAKDNGPEQGQKDSAAKDKAAPDKAPALKPTNSKAKANKDEDGEDQPVIKMGDPASDYQLSRALDLLRGLSLYRGQPKAN